jgi:hypothetical protein
MGGSMGDVEEVVFEFAIWGPLAVGIGRAPIFGHIFDLDALNGETVGRSVALLHTALDRLAAFGVPAPPRSQPPDDKTRLTFPVLGWYLQILADVAESFRYRAPSSNPQVWRISPPELR